MIMLVVILSKLKWELEVKSPFGKKIKIIQKEELKVQCTQNIGGSWTFISGVFKIMF